MRERDSVRSWLRTSRAQRRVGPAAACACGESRPYTLIAGCVPPCCFRCERLARGRPPYELNHVFGQHNSDLTIRYPINDHRAVLSVKQLDWTDESLENPNGDVLLVGIARFQGLENNTAQMLADCIAFAPQLKHVQELLVTIYGEKWLPGLEADAKRVSRKAVKKSRP
jgi:hypothetical protein